LDAVQAIVREVRRCYPRLDGSRARNNLANAATLTLSIVRALLVEIGTRAYAFPLVHINRALKVAKKDIEVTAGRQHFRFEDRQIGLIAANQIFGGRGRQSLGRAGSSGCHRQQSKFYGVVTGKFLGERELVIRPLDPRLGKIKDISSGALLMMVYRF